MAHDPSEEKTELDGASPPLTALASSPNDPALSSGSGPQIPDHQLLRRIGSGSYGEVWLARNVMGTYRAVKIVYRSTFSSERPYEREFSGIQKFEPISRSHEGLVDVLQVGRNDPAGYFYYVMELADDAHSVGESVSDKKASPPTPLPTYSLTHSLPSQSTPASLEKPLGPKLRPAHFGRNADTLVRMRPNKWADRSVRITATNRARCQMRLADAAGTDTAKCALKPAHINL